ncbi:MAG: PDZ domain-containing protein [Deltaproteobacteria bacterium]|nr:MAG: PDZ domain-containing protein [Deltaproteobacteria bacterium]
MRSDVPALPGSCRWLLAWVAATVGLAGGGCAEPQPEMYSLAAPTIHVPAAPVPVSGPVVPRSDAPSSFAALVERVRPAVVNIHTTQEVDAVEFAAALLGSNGAGRDNQSLGSGFLIDDDGLILTSGHVIEKATEIRVILHNGTRVAADVVGLDRATDLALLRITPPEGIRPLALAGGDAIRVGDWVIAVGNPFGLASTVTAGIVSAIGRQDLELGRELTLADLLQTDASINPGNSGGPLVNMDGDVVGINTAINREGQGIGFAIPAHVARTILQPLRDEGRVRRAWLGIRMRPIDEEVAVQHGLEEGNGVRVTHVTEDGPAYRAGIRRDDLLLRFNEADIRNTTDLRWTVGMAGIGNTVPIELLRAGSTLTVEVTLGRMPEPD